MEFNFAFVVELPFKAVVSPVYYKFLIFTFQVMIIEKSGMTLNFLVPDGFHSLLRAVVSKNPTAIADCIWKTSEIKDKVEDLVSKDIENQCQNLCSSQSSSFGVEKSSLKSVTHKEQAIQLSEKDPAFIKC